MEIVRILLQNNIQNYLETKNASEKKWHKHTY